MSDRRYPFYHLVPKDRDENIAWRKDVLTQAANDPGLQEELRVMCARDILFWTNTFIWVHETREWLNSAVRTEAVDGLLPYNTYELQDQNIPVIEDCLGREDLCIRKSRETFGTWTVLLVFTHQIDFLPEARFLAVSRDARRVDVRGDYATLLPKVDFIHENMPGWLRPPIERKEMLIRNMRTGSFIKGESTTGEIARSGRYKGILLDEHGFFKLRDGYRANAATLGATPCRIFLSTYNGTGNAYAEKDEDPNIKHLVFPWWEDPRKNPGLYQFVDGELKIYDTHYQYPADYEFVLDGKLRSPWRDAEGRREPDPAVLAGEVDMDKYASKSRYYPDELIDGNKLKYGREPDYVGELQYDTDTLEPIGFIEIPNGRLKIWNPRPGSLLDAEGKIRPQPGIRYGHAADIGAGVGRTPSTFSIGELDTHTKVAELEAHGMSPEDFGRMAIAYCRWFNDAFAIWDAGGPGAQYGQQFIDYGYLHCYFRQVEDSISRIPTDKPGYYAASGTRGGPRMTLLGYYRSALVAGLIERENWPDGTIEPFINPSVPSLNELRQYVFGDDGVVAHAKGRETTDASGRKFNHADQGFADALLNFAMVKYGDQIEAPKPTAEINLMSMQGRLIKFERDKERPAPNRFRVLEVRT